LNLLWACSPTPLRAADVGLVTAAALACGLAVRAAGPAAPGARAVFLEDSRVPWWAAGLALFCSETTALTFIAVPAAAYAGGWGFVQLFLGSLLGRAAALTLSARQRASGALTVYGAAAPGAGPQASRAAAALFCAGRALSSALRLVAAALALSLLSGLGPGWCALVLCAAAAAVAGYGGLRGVIWTAPVQAAVILLAAAVLPLYTMRQIPGGLNSVLALAANAGRLTLGDAGPAWRAWLLGAVGAAAGFSADHELAQKLLCCRTDSGARRALILATALGGALLVLLLAAGTCLFAYYQAHPALAVPERLDKMLPHFAATILPAPLRGLALAGIALAAVDLPVSSLSAASWADLARGGSRLPGRARWALACGWSAALLLLCLWMLSSDAPAAWGALAWPAAGGALLALCAGAAWRKPGTGAALGALAAGLAAAAFTERASAGGALPVDPGWLTLAGAAAGAALLWGATRPSAQ
jgi:Na+/proline symporter